MVAISKNWWDFNAMTAITYDSIHDPKQFLQHVCFSMVEQSSSNLFKESIYMLRDVNLMMTTVKSVHHLSPSAMYFFNNHEKELNAQIQGVFKKIRSYLLKRMLNKQDEQRADLIINKEFVAWMGHINLVPAYRFWKVEIIDKVQQFVEISLDEVLKSHVEFCGIPPGESKIMLEQMIANSLACQSEGLLYPTIHTLSKNLGTELNFRSSAKCLKFPEEFEIFRKNFMPELQPDCNAYTILQNDLKKEYYMIISNWQGGLDTTYFIHVEMAKNFVQSPSEI